MEYIPDLEEINLDTYTEDRVRAVRDILHKTHEAHIYHGDVYPRNMRVQLGTGRVVWIDFDKAQTFPV